MNPCGGATSFQRFSYSPCTLIYDRWSIDLRRRTESQIMAVRLRNMALGRINMLRSGLFSHVNIRTEVTLGDRVSR